jgi:flagellar assembly factor FliW
MLLKTKHFDEIEIEEEKIINFKDGIPVFCIGI